MGGTAGAEFVFGEKVLVVMVVVMQFVSFVLMGGRLVKGLLWPKAGSDMVVPVLNEGGEEEEKEEEEVLLLRRDVRDRDERLRDMSSNLQAEREEKELEREEKELEREE